MATAAACLIRNPRKFCGCGWGKKKKKKVKLLLILAEKLHVLNRKLDQIITKILSNSVIEGVPVVAQWVKDLMLSL